jgi:hypothetical protein
MNSLQGHIMELDDLKSAWQILDRRLEQQAALNLHIFKQGKLDRMRSTLRPLFWGQILQIFFGVAMVLLAVSFWTQHRDVPHLLFTGLIVHVYGVVTIIFAGVTLGMIGRIDHSAPVLGIQKQLAQLRRTYIINGMSVGLPWWVLWLPLMQMFFMGAFGADLYTNLGIWIWGTYAIGVLGLLATWWFHRWSRDPRRARVAKFVDDSVTGSSLRNARRVLDEIASFEKS